mmetsp:Transcript_4023/g.5356  ORF Transcript_4023/g.5356 Transcript_4023/m.5356 type:complete len:302 (+) Transcript_4023:125-1030(+)
MQVNTTRTMAAVQEKAADSPMKNRRDLSFSHFSRRYRSKLANSDAFYVRFNTDAGLAAVSFFDGSLQIISTMLGDRLYQIHDDEMVMPVTSLAWKPSRDESTDSQKLLGACLNGSIIRWTANHSNTVEHISLNDEQMYHAIDFSGDPRRFCVAGTQPYIEIYDEDRMQRVQQIGDRVNPAHSNKIFTCKFNPQAPNMLVSGSWDKQVRFWDVRANRLNISIGGKTSICGDGVDVSYCNNYAVTGGGTLGEGVQIWDLRRLEKPVKKMVWSIAYNGDIINPIVNSVKFIPRQNLVMAGCSDD